MKRLIFPILLFLLSILAVWPFIKTGFFSTHDGDWMVIRFSAFHQTLTAGQFPTRFLDRLNNNYGYPVANFLYPLPFYAAEIPKVLKFGYVDSIKIVFVISTIASVLAMYWALKQRFTSLAAFAGAVIYLYIPYRFVDLYVRGSLGECLAFVFPPICIGAIYKISQGDKKYLPILSISTALLIISHNVVALLFLPLILLFIFFMQKNKKEMIMFLFIGILCSAFFVLPALYDLQYVRLSQIKVSEIANYLVSPLKILLPSWGFDPNPNSRGGMSVQFGIVSMAIVIAASYLLLVRNKREYNLITLIAVYIAIFFLMTVYSGSVWQNVPYIDIVQFPWRLLALIVFISAFLGAYLVDSFKNKKLIAALIICGSIISTLPYALPHGTNNLPDTFYSTNESTTTVRDEYMPIWVKTTKSRAGEKIQVTPPAGLENMSIRPASYSFNIKNTQNTNVIVNTVYFPGWQVKSNGVSVPINYHNPQGLITFKLPKGESKVIIKYSKTPVHLLAEIISLAGLVVTGFFFYRLWRKQNSSKQNFL